ncbi:MAG TPA: glycosyltransferase family 4 protein [Candidatus Babeliales bacterium]|nr:glycosyltransferase family 4 protein [Candidatus Babeliales bacterium]
MKVKIQQFLYQNHSWKIVGENIAKALIQNGDIVHLYPTDKDKQCHLSDEFKKYEVNIVDKIYDCQIGYTAPINWPIYFRNGSKNRFAIWNYEYRGLKLLPGFAKNYRSVDKVLPSSNFTKEVFLDMGIPEERMIVVPHGIDLELFSVKGKFKLNTKRKIKILLNIAQPHKRKALPLALKTFGEAFTKNDDVCLVAKISTSNKTDHQFNVDFHKLYNEFRIKYKNHAEVEIVTSFITNIAELYNACDVNFSATHTECWHLPSLEALAAGVVNVVPRYGGILDFCNNDNSLLIDGKVVRAPRDHQYWQSSPYAQHFEIDLGDAVKKLKFAVEHCDELKQEMSSYMRNTAEKFTWTNVINQIKNLCEK